MKRRARIIHAKAHSIEPVRGYAILQLAGVTAGNELTHRAGRSTSSGCTESTKKKIAKCNERKLINRVIYNKKK